MKFGFIKVDFPDHEIFIDDERIQLCDSRDGAIVELTPAQLSFIVEQHRLHYGEIESPIGRVGDDAN